MSRRIHLTDLAADEQLLDRLGARSDAGHEPVAVLLAALARHADQPLRSGPPPRRVTRRRTLTALTALVVGASGAGVAAAVTQPQTWLTREPSRVTAFEAAPRPAAPERSLSQLALPSLPAPVVASDGYVLVRDAAGQIVLLPPKVVVEVPVVDAPAPVAPPAGEPVAALVGEPVVEQAVSGPDEAAPQENAQAASSPGRAGRAPESTILASGPTAAKAKPAPSVPPGKSKPRETVDPATTEESLTLASLPPDPEPPGQAVAALRRPSTPGTESGPGVPARPERPAPAEKPDHAKEPKQPEHVDRDGIGTPGSAHKPDQKPSGGAPSDSDKPAPPASPGGPDKPAPPAGPGGPDKPGKPAATDDPEKPGASVPARPEAPAQPDRPATPAKPEQATKPDPGPQPAPLDGSQGPDTSKAPERPPGAEVPAAAERPSLPAAPADTPPAEPAS